MITSIDVHDPDYGEVRITADSSKDGLCFFKLVIPTGAPSMLEMSHEDVRKLYNMLGQHLGQPQQLGLVRVEFRLIRGATQDYDTRITTVHLAAVPAPGELVNINGDPYVVFERSYSCAVGDNTLYAVLRVTNLQAPKL